MTNPVKHVRSCVHLNINAGGLHNHADDDKEHHEDEALDAAPDVDDLGNGEVGDAADDARNDGGCGEERMLAK